MKNYHPVIGLEIHLTIINDKKSFSHTPINQISWNSLGLLGTLPQISLEAIKSAIKLSHALKMNINYSDIHFDRKNYFYFDLPRGYQITQFFHPIGKKGYIELSNNKKILIRQLHIEEDTAKQIKHGHSIELFFERLGNPLFEIVTEPCFSSFEEVEEFLYFFRAICIFLKISSCEYENGELRVDLNISIGDGKGNILTPRSEIKNLNSLQSIKKSIEYQTHYLISALNNNELLEAYTYSWVDKLEICQKMRKKSSSQEYFYIPEANIPKISFTAEEIYNLLSAENNFFEFHQQLLKSELTEKEIKNLLSHYHLFTQAEELNKELNDWKKTYIWISNLLEGVVNNSKIDNKEVEYNFQEIKKAFIQIQQIKNINVKTIKEIIKEIVINKLNAKEAIKLHKVESIDNDEEILSLIYQVLDKNTEQLEKLSQNMLKFEKFLIGELMKQTKGQINPQLTSDLFKKNINNYLKQQNITIKT